MKIRLIVAIIISLLLIPTISIEVGAQPPDWIIDGDTVYIDDANVYMSATPHTLASSGWVEFQLVSKNYEGAIDIIWGFNEADGMKPSQPQVWINDQWQPLNLPISTLNIEYNDCDTWRLIRLGNGITKNKLYRARCWVQIPFAGNDVLEGKYTFAAKPSGETMTEAVLNNHLYILDPWWHSSWGYKKQLTFDNSASAENLVNFPVLVHLDDTNIDWAHVQNAGQDIRFIDSDDSTELDYEIEEWDDTNDAWIWVEVPQIDVGSTTDFIYMYYGNASATDGQDVEGTWNSNYETVWHMHDNPDTSHVVDSTDQNNDGTKKGANEPLETDDLFISLDQDFDGSDDYMSGLTPACVDHDGTFSVMIWLEYEAAGNRVAWVLDQGVEQMILWIRSGWLHFQKDDGVAYTFIQVNTRWTTPPHTGLLTCVMDGGVQTIYLNSTASTTVGDGAIARAGTVGLELGDRSRTGYWWDGQMDELRILEIAVSADWIEAQYLSMTDVYITFSSEEDILLPPTNFSLTNVNDNQVDITWTKGVGANKTMIRRKLDDYPTDRTDGALVYHDTASSYTDTGDEIGLELDKYTYYYRAWSESVGNTWSDPVEDYIGGENMGALASALESLSTVGLTWLALIAVVAVSGLAFWKPIAPIFMILAAMSMMLGLQWYDVHSTELGMGISLGLIAYSIVCLGFTYRVIFQSRHSEAE